MEIKKLFTVWVLYQADFENGHFVGRQWSTGAKNINKKNKKNQTNNSTYKIGLILFKEGKESSQTKCREGPPWEGEIM